MAYTRINYRDVDPVGGGLHFLREPLGTANLGVTVREMEPGETGRAHDHADDGQEEVYVLVDGAVTATVDGEDVPLEPGDALRVDPAAERRLRSGDVESRLVVVGAP